MQRRPRENCLMGHPLTEGNIKFLKNRDRIVRRCLTCYNEHLKTIRDSRFAAELRETSKKLREVS